LTLQPSVVAATDIPFSMYFTLLILTFVFYKNIIMTVHKKLTRVRRTIYDSS